MPTHNKEPDQNIPPRGQSSLISACYGVIITLALILLVFGVFNWVNPKTPENKTNTATSLVISTNKIAPIKPGLYTNHPHNLGGTNLQLVRDLKEKNRNQSNKIVFLSQKVSNLEEQLSDIKINLFRKNAPEDNLQLAQIFQETNEKEEKLEEFSTRISNLEQNLTQRQTALNEIQRNMEVKDIEISELNEKFQLSSNELESEKFFSGELTRTLESSALSQNENNIKLENYEKALIENEYQIGELLSKIQDLSSGIESRLNQSINLEETLEIKSSENATLQNQLDEKEELILRQLQETAQQQKAIDDLIQKNSLAKNLETNFLEQTNALENQLSEKKTEILAMQTSLESKQQEVSELYEQMQSASTDKENKEAYAKTSELLAKIYELATDIEAQSSKINNLKETMEIKSTQNKSLKKELEQSAINMQQNLKQIDDFKTQNDSFIQDMETNFFDQITNLENELNEKQTEILVLQTTLDNKQQEITKNFEEQESSSDDLALFSQNLESYKKTIDEKETQIGELLDKIYNLTFDMQTLSQKTTTAEELFETTSSQNHNLKKQLEESADNIHQHLQDIKVYEDNLSNQENELDEKRDEILDLQTTLESKQQEFIEFSDQTLLTSNDNDDNLTTYKKAIEEKDNQIGELLDRTYYLIADMESQAAKIGNFEEVLEATSNQNQSLKKQLQESALNIHKNLQDATIYRDRSNELQNEIDDLRNESVSNVQNMEEKFLEQISYLENELNGKKDNLIAMETEINNKQREFNEFNSSASFQNDEHKKELEEQIQSLTSNLEAMTLKINDQLATIDTYRSQSDEKEESIQEQLNEISKLQQALYERGCEIGNIQKENEELALVIKEKDTTTQSLHANIEKLQTEKSTLSEAIDQENILKKENDRLIQHLEIEQNHKKALEMENQNAIKYNEELENELQEHRQNRQKMIDAINSKKIEIENLNLND